MVSAISCSSDEPRPSWMPISPAMSCSSVHRLGHALDRSADTMYGT